MLIHVQASAFLLWRFMICLYDFSCTWIMISLEDASSRSWPPIQPTPDVWVLACSTLFPNANMKTPRSWSVCIYTRDSTWKLRIVPLKKKWHRRFLLEIIILGSMLNFGGVMLHASPSLQSRWALRQRILLLLSSRRGQSRELRHETKEKLVFDNAGVWDALDQQLKMRQCDFANVRIHWLAGADLPFPLEKRSHEMCPTFWMA